MWLRSYLKNGGWRSHIFDDLSASCDWGKVQGVKYHAGEPDDDGYYYADGGDSSCEGLIIFIIFVSEHISWVEEIYFFDDVVNSF